MACQSQRMIHFYSKPFCSLQDIILSISIHGAKYLGGYREK